MMTMLKLMEIMKSDGNDKSAGSVGARLARQLQLLHPHGTCCQFYIYSLTVSFTFDDHNGHKYGVIGV